MMRLSDRQVQVVRLVCMGYTDKQIAKELFLSPSTVKHHLGNAAERLGACNRANVVYLALRRGVLDLMTLEIM